MMAPRRTTTRRPLIELIVGALSSLAVLALLGYLLNQAMFHDDHPAELAVVVERIAPRARETVVHFALENSGDRAAAAVHVYAMPTEGEDNAMIREIVIDYVAGHAVRRGAFIFPRTDLSAGDLRLGIGGYAEP